MDIMVSTALVSDVKLKSVSQLTEAERVAWQKLRASNPALYSPYFTLEYTEQVDRARQHIRVVCVYGPDGPIAFLPLQGRGLGSYGFALPVGAPMTDYHGFICAADTVLDTKDILRRAKIGAFHYSARIDQSGTFAKTVNTSECAVVDLFDGVKNWQATRDSSYSRHLKTHRRRVRKATEDIGAPRCVWASQDVTVFDQLMTWKKEKFQLTGKYDVLSVGWTLSLLKSLWAEPSGGVRCDMHVLYFGDRVAAIDLGLTDGDTFHSWIVAYDSDLHTYAPGIQLLEALFEASDNLGYIRIDLGAGLDGYKRHYTSDPVFARSGFIAASGSAAMLSKIYHKTEALATRSPLGPVSRLPGKLRRRYTQIAACDPRTSGRVKAMLSAVKTSSG